MSDGDRFVLDMFSGMRSIGRSLHINTVPKIIAPIPPIIKITKTIGRSDLRVDFWTAGGLLVGSVRISRESSAN